MGTDTRKAIKVFPLEYQSIGCHLKKIRWAFARLSFMAGMIFGSATFVGSYLLAPFYSYWFFGTFRFWRHIHMWPSLVFYAYYFAYIYLKGDFVLSIPYTAAPMSKPDLSKVSLNPLWRQASGCGDCSKCCRKIKCPLVDEENGNCMSYNTFYWRYFNCGRFPTSQDEIDRYECPKWEMK
jgi:hypothetical protein